MRAVKIKGKEYFKKGQWVWLASRSEIERDKMWDEDVYHELSCKEQKALVKGGVAILDEDFKILDIEAYL